MNHLEIIACGQYLSEFHNFKGTFHELIQSLGTNEIPETITVVEAFENYDPYQVANLLSSLVELLTTNLEDVKRGIVESAINCTLDPDMNSLDMDYMAEIGRKARLEETA